MNYTYQDYLKMYEQIAKRTDFKPLIGAVLGSGLGNVVNKVDIKAIIPYSEIEGMPCSTNKAHKGQFVFGYFKGVPMVLMQGRIHMYEGYTPQEVTLPIRLMKMMGIRSIILTNAAGALDPSYRPGDCMLIDDHISSFVPSPLIGNNIDEFGDRFPCMSPLYGQEQNNYLYNRARERGIPVQRGVYVQFSGPQYETKAEIHLAQIVGANAVGMSTVIEAIVAKQMGLYVMGFSLISNMAAGIAGSMPSDEEVLKQANASEKNVYELFALEVEMEAERLKKNG
ncbi:MAG: purine-nucleoside phosphorylase [Bacilli bacterium]|nr:purine-nucleoside phosphorylase [Bacilli bacterium]